jgi:hypothetical protein
MLDRVLRYATDPDFWIQAVLTSIVGIILGGLIALSWRNAKLSYQYAKKSRERRRQQNYVEIRRRIRNCEYLLYSEQEEQSVTFGVLFTFLLIAAITLFSFLSQRPDDMLLLLFLVILLPLLFFAMLRASLLANLNRAARAFRAGLVKNKKSRLFEWPPERPRRAVGPAPDERA